MREQLGWSPDELRAILKGLGFASVRKPGDAPSIWRRRFEKEFAVEVKAPPPHSPFAALAALKGAAPEARRPRRRRKPKLPAGRVQQG